MNTCHTSHITHHASHITHHTSLICFTSSEVFSRMLMVSVICGCPSTIIAAAAASSLAHPSLNHIATAAVAVAECELQLSPPPSTSPSSPTAASRRCAAADVMRQLLPPPPPPPPPASRCRSSATGAPIGCGGAFAAQEQVVLQGGTAAMIQPLLHVVLAAFR